MSAPSARPPLVAGLILAALAVAGCGGRDGSWSRANAPTATTADRVSLRVRSFEEKKDQVTIVFEVANDGDEPITFGVEPFNGRIIHERDYEQPDATTFIEVGGQRVAFYTAGKTGAYDVAAEANVAKTLAAGFGGKRIAVAPRKLQRLSLKFLPHPKLASARAPIALSVSDVRRGDTRLAPLRVEIR